MLLVDQTLPDGFCKLYEKKKRATLKNDIEGLDAKAQEIYHALFNRIYRNIKVHLELINDQMKNGQAGKEFLGSYVYYTVVRLTNSSSRAVRCSQQKPSSVTLQEPPPSGSIDR